MSEIEMSVKEFADLLFDKEKQKQFIEECERLGIIDDELKEKIKDGE